MVVIGGLAVGAALLTLAIAGALSLEAVDKDAQQKATAGASEVAAAYVEALTAATQVAKELETNATMAVRLRHATRARQLARLRAILEREPDFSGVWLIAEPDGFDGPDALHKGAFGSSADGDFFPYWYRRPDGRIVQDTTGRRRDVDEDRARDFYRLPVTRSGVTIIPPFEYRMADGRGATTSMMSVAAPVRVDGRLIGVAGVDLFLDDLSADLADSLGDGRVEFAVVNDGGEIVAASRPAWRGRRAAEVGAPSLAATSAGRGISVAVADWAGERATIASRRVHLRGHDQSWTVLVGHPRSAAYAEIARITVGIMLLATFLVMSSVLFAYWLGRTLARPVVDMAATMRRMAEGDLDVPAPATAVASELQDMALALEQFRHSARQALEAEARRQAAEAIAREKGALLDVLSHEVRTPLNGILGMAQALARLPMPERHRDAVKVILSSGHTLGGLLDRVLEQSRIRDGEVTLSSEPFVPAETIRQAAVALRRQCRAKRVRLSVEARALGRETAIGDEIRFRQILDILLGNALRFTEAGRIAVRARWVSSAARRDIAVEVSDTGIGIPPGAQDRLFTAFGLADFSSTRRQGGAGLGLAMCRDLVELMGGEVRVESQPGVGSTFTVLLPMTPPDPCAEPASGDPQRPDKLRILVAEDNPTNRQVLAALLSPLNAEIAYAEDGAAAVGLFVASTFDVVLMDLRMPVMDGWEATRRIRAAEASTGVAPTPVIAVTANTSPADLRLCHESGIDAVVAKPIRFPELFGVLSAVLEAADARSQGVQATTAT